MMRLAGPTAANSLREAPPPVASYPSGLISDRGALVTAVQADYYGITKVGLKGEKFVICQLERTSCHQVTRLPCEERK